MVVLPRGITGFRHVDDPPLPVCNMRLFRGRCDIASHAVGGRVVSTESSLRRVEASFVCVTLELLSGPVSVVLNRIYPVLAFVVPPSHHPDKLRFVDVPALSGAFRDFGIYEILTALEAQAPVTDEARRELAPVEVEELQYWRPQCVGEVVFNYWD